LATTSRPTGEPLPALFARWMVEALGRPIPRERRASCDACVMCAPGQDEGPDARLYFFDPALKCCTFTPALPNFLVGRILQDEAAADGLASTVKRINARLGVTPMGLAAPAVAALLYRTGADAFGRARPLRCPHFVEDGGKCGIWRHREATCATWFCKHMRGAIGFSFWRGALHPLLQTIERDLARWCVIEEGGDEETLEQLVGSSAWALEAEAVDGDALNGVLDEAAYRRLWGRWSGRETEFYQRCAERVDTLSWTRIMDICGPEARAYARLTETALARLSDQSLPERLVVGSYRVVQRRQGTARICTFSEFDPLDVPESVLGLLSHFDGRPTMTVLAAIAEAEGVVFEDALVRKLVDFGLLTEPSRSGRA
jgi:hypothetical protein